MSAGKNERETERRCRWCGQDMNKSIYCRKNPNDVEHEPEAAPPLTLEDVSWPLSAGTCVLREEMAPIEATAQPAAEQLLLADFEKHYQAIPYKGGSKEVLFHDWLYESLLRSYRAAGGATEMYLCEVSHLILRPDQSYIFRKHPECDDCKKYLIGAAAEAPRSVLEEIKAVLNGTQEPWEQQLDCIEEIVNKALAPAPPAEEEKP